jgi:hypothetical protein
LVQLISLSSYPPSLKQIEFTAAVHLPSDELDAGDLPLGLSVGPGQYDCRANRRFIVRYSAGEWGDKAGASALDPGWQLGGGSAPDHPVEFGYDLSSFDKGGNASLDGPEVCGLGSVTATPACSHARISSPLK